MARPTMTASAPATIASEAFPPWAPTPGARICFRPMIARSALTRPERVSALRAIIGRKQILAPGVGAQGGKASEAIVAGADAVIVGRAIYEAANPAAAATAIATEIRSVVSR